MAHFLLIHGACHGGWCWERIEPLLEAAGHRAEAPDLPGHGGDPTPLSELSMEAARNAFYQDADDPTLDMAFDRIGPEPVHVFREKAIRPAL